MLLGKPHETSTTLYSYVVEEETSENATSSASTTPTSYHCAWCGEDPDENGSHGICPTHDAAMRAVSAERRRKRGRS